MNPDADLDKTVDESQALLTEAFALFHNYNADSVMYVMGWLMALHVHHVVDHKLATEDEAMATVVNLIRTAYIAQGEDNDQGS